MKLGVTGTRRHDDFYWICEQLDALFDPKDVELLISGNAIGVDRNCEIWAKAHSIPVKLIKPDYEKHKENPKYAPIARNRDIASECDVLVAFLPTSGSNGTQSTINYAKDLNKKVIIVPVNL
jgi:predicted Rossmann fold nucleotide-binding protein DprA/Smf involved in DNA uptake